MPKKLSLYKSVKTERGWRYCKAAFHSNAKVKPNIVLVDGSDEKHAEGSYFTLSDNQWVALGDDALEAQRKLMAMNAQREFQRLSQQPQQRESPVPVVSNGRKLIRVQPYSHERIVSPCAIGKSWHNKMLRQAISRKLTGQHGKPCMQNIRSCLLPLPDSRTAALILSDFGCVTSFLNSNPSWRQRATRRVEQSHGCCFIAVDA